MAAAGAVRAARRARRSFDIFVADVPWTVSSSECAPQRLPSLPVGRGGGLGLRGSRGDWGRVITALFPPAEELKEYFAQFGAVQRCQLPFVSSRDGTGRGGTGPQPGALSAAPPPRASPGSQPLNSLPLWVLGLLSSSLTFFIQVLETHPSEYCYCPFSIINIKIPLIN